MTESNSQCINNTLRTYGFQKYTNLENCSPLGMVWRINPAVGSGYFWIYNYKDLFSIKIHHFSFHQDTIINANMPEGLNIAYYTSISGEELNPYKRLNANCIRSYLNGHKAFKAIIHKNIPVHSIEVEILPTFYNNYLKKLYPTENINPYSAFLDLDETKIFPEMVTILKQIENYKGSGIAGVLFYQAKITEAVSLILERQKRKVEVQALSISNFDREQIDNVTAYISEHYAFELTIEQLAKLACMGETKFKKIFKQIHHCTVLEFIQNQRITQAKYLIGNTDYSIKQIAQLVGYTHTSHFASLFKNVTGLLPGEYRKCVKENILCNP